jgi:hypothetical protein
MKPSRSPAVHAAALASSAWAMAVRVGSIGVSARVMKDVMQMASVMQSPDRIFMAFPS